MTQIINQIGDSMNITARLNEIASFGNDDDSNLPTDASIAAMREFLETTIPSSTTIPYLYATHDKGVVAEWTLLEWELSAEIDAIGENICMNAVNVHTGDVIDKQIALSSIYLVPEFIKFMAVDSGTLISNTAKCMEYNLVSSSNVELFNKKVNALIQEGFSLRGDVDIIYSVHENKPICYQAMIKTE